MKTSFYAQSLALLTDFYQITMAYGYWKTGIANREAIFHLFFRRPPFHGGFTIAAGLEGIVKYLESFSFDASDLEYLGNLTSPAGAKMFPSEFLDYLAKMKFSADIDAVPEGSVVFPYEPLLRIKGPLIQCQLLESSFLNLINFPSLIATKAARMCVASKGEPILEFGLRRAQGVDGALTASRSAYIGGCDSTSNVLAGKLFGIPVKGTHSHSWVMVFEDELEAFKAYAEALPDNCVFLVDTFDSLDGVKRAIEVGKMLKEKGKSLVGIRLDSGDLAYLSIKTRDLLDTAGFLDTKIFASNELDETLINELKRQGAQINVWGVGTHLVTGKEQPALDGVYKLSAIQDAQGQWKNRLKLSEQMVKVSNPGIMQVRRYSSSQGYVADAIYDIRANLDGQDCSIVDPIDSTKQRVIKKTLKHEDLLKPVYRQGKLVYDLPTIEQIRKRTKEELDKFPDAIKRFINPHTYFVGLEKSLYDEKMNLVKKVRHPAHLGD